MYQQFTGLTLSNELLYMGLYLAYSTCFQDQSREVHAPVFPWPSVVRSFGLRHYVIIVSHEGFYVSRQNTSRTVCPSHLGLLFITVDYEVIQFLRVPPSQYMLHTSAHARGSLN